MSRYLMAPFHLAGTGTQNWPFEPPSLEEIALSCVERGICPKCPTVEALLSDPVYPDTEFTCPKCGERYSL